MPQPTEYNRTFDFTDFQEDFPHEPLPAGPVDANLDLIAISVNQIIARLALIQRDDGFIANASIGIDQLSSEIDMGFSALTTWDTAVAYAPRNGVYFGANIYYCLVAHTSNTFSVDLAAGKWLLVANLQQFIDQSSASATAASASETASAASAVSAAAAAANLSGTSATSLTLGTGSRIFTTQAGKQFTVGAAIIAASAANPSVNLMTGVITAYTSTTLTVNMTAFAGAGTYTDWLLNISGIQGAAGAAGAPGPGTGDMIGANNLSDLISASTARGNLGLGTAALAATGTSGHTVPYLDGVNIFAAGQTLPDPIITGSVAHVAECRLTATTGVAVTTADVTGATSLYVTPFKGNFIALYISSKWQLRAFTEKTISLASGYVSGKPYDVFAYDNAGTLAVETLAWTNDTTRVTALALQDGVLVKSGDVTRRYLGTFYTTSATTTEDSLVKRFVYNYYNRMSRPMKRVDPAPNWTYTLNSYRQANGSTANQLDFIQGVAEDTVKAHLVSEARNSVAATLLTIGIGLDSVVVNSAINAQARVPVASYEIQLTALYDAIPGVGRHFLAWLESSGAVGTTTWVGDQVAIQSGISGSVMA